MLDIKWIRDEPEGLRTALLRRGQDEAQAAATVADVLARDDARRAHLAALHQMQERRNAASKEIGKAKGARDEARAAELMAEVAHLKEDLQAGEAKARELDEALTAALAVIPNVPLDEVPDGRDERDNVVYRTHGEPRRIDWAKEHFDLGEGLGLMDFERAAKLSGARFTVLKGGLARLERALGQFMLDLHTGEHGYTEVIPPLLVRDETMYGTGNLPKFAEDLFRTTDGRWLIPTAEVSLTNLVREEILDDGALPIRMTALTPCFRSEAGSAGRDTRGMLRQHQFDKVELVSITAADKSMDEHERMLSSAEEVLKRLGLAYRVVTLCTGDMGFASRKTYDIEVWLPGQKAFREISSCSVCGDFQARRMNARYRPADEKSTRFVHTLNGSGVAVGRALIAVMETWQNEDGSITVPDALRGYMGGLERIARS
ncbi:serine--tRNA ligase [Oharaeibacter diazotrophicus]|uniref:Serine--tRNA ligase n=1 Tax=Oharaeibacter diazotrophicus TaxID=1920512 RepID=A0A4R6RKK0_9HYPH|nr:serine--tRNA ligase [Oharaeibacter diazotrophicus]TDP87004.1 seryl-tRNA synthetase [Oharaeibacter diazotrophicus]BBE71053.1 serine-tRNA ligase [Pleomorphomonas sp. SM30]GLS77804.1 serine--tRNA ligase [Oharaeibacter diazotrophicus]